MASNGKINITGADYKNAEWIKEKFLNIISEDETGEKIEIDSKLTLHELAKSHTDRFSDFCVIEGITVEFEL